MRQKTGMIRRPRQTSRLVAATRFACEPLERRVMLAAVVFDAPPTYPAGSSPVSVTTGDYNGDGTSDLAVATCGATSVRVSLKIGTGTSAEKIAYAAGAAPTAVATGDFNGDGEPDLAVSNKTGNSVSVLLNVGNG